MAETKRFKGIRMPGMNDFYVLPEAVAIEDENGFVEIQSYISDTIEIENLDSSLSVAGVAADAKAVGEALANKAPKSYILHGTIDENDNITLTNYNWDELVAAATSNENTYVAIRLTDEGGSTFDFPLSANYCNDPFVFMNIDFRGRIFAIDVGEYENVEGYDLATKENWTFTLEDGSTVTKAVYVG